MDFDPGPEDLITTVELTVPEESPIRGTRCEAQGEGQHGCSGRCDGDHPVRGSEAGQVILVVFDDHPPVLLSLKRWMRSRPDGDLNAVAGGTAQILAFLDLEPFNMQMPDVTDPQVSSAPFDVNGEPVNLELTLE